MSGRMLVVWHSATGASRQLAMAASEAATAQNRVDADGTETLSLHCSKATPADVLAADGYMFVCPENLATMAGLMKDFFDRCYYPVLGKIEGRPYAIVISAGSDGHGAAAQIARIATGWRLKPVAEPLIVNVAAQTPEAILAPKTLSETQLAGAAEYGAALAAGLSLGVF